MKSSRKKPLEGDVFILQPQDNLFMYGKVIKVNVSSKDPFVNGGNLVYIYKKQSADKIMPDVLSPNDLLFPPMVTNHQGWLKGYFEMIGNNGITEDELDVNFGFWHKTSEKFYNLHGEVLQDEPLQWTGSGLVSYGGIGRAIHRIFRGESHLL
ncbi:immunity 26/phosphotriesterase HocA family protein [Paenibacillus aestuarii]|uniref:Immunity 26/phosphotriesterase HocA family protein n=1 Tax=Paenibacillus aestuarii TaxID=516965 RepID=A0ABW0K0Y3_9BACL|nr:immunity 26/phosphotriesterase HocA family protein [Paenibacillus aestuarii]